MQSLPQPKRVLLVVYLRTHFNELWRLARALQASKRWAPFFVFARSYPSLPSDLARCTAEGIGFSVFAHRREAGKAPPGTVSFWQRVAEQSRRLPGRVTAAVRKAAHRVAGGLFGHAWQLRSARRLLHAQQAALVVLAEENVGYPTGIFVEAARRRQVPVLVVPYTMANALEPAEAVQAHRRCQVRGWARRVFATAYPQWVYCHNGSRLIRLPMAQALALEYLGLAPPNPWILNSGGANAIAVESEAMKAYYLRAGLPADRLVLTGSLADDVLSNGLLRRAERRRALYSRLGLPADRPMALSALPPNQLGKSRTQCDFQQYQSLLRFWVDGLAQANGFNKVLLLHPSVAHEDWRSLESVDCKIASEDTAEVIPLCDFYVASVSATIRWAIACGKPVINYDVYRYRYSDFQGMDGVITVEEQTDYVNTLRRMATEPAFFAEKARQQALEMERWGRLDGHAADRLLELCKTLTTNRRSTTP
jgi:hypothetical protein